MTPADRRRMFQYAAESARARAAESREEANVYRDAAERERELAGRGLGSHGTSSRKFSCASHRYRRAARESGVATAALRAVECLLDQDSGS